MGQDGHMKERQYFGERDRGDTLKERPPYGERRLGGHTERETVLW